MGTSSHFFGMRKDGSEFPIEVGLDTVLTMESAVAIQASTGYDFDIHVVIVRLS
jgi:hypothetical protein